MDWIKAREWCYPRFFPPSVWLLFGLHDFLWSVAKSGKEDGFSTQDNGDRATGWHFIRWLNINKEDCGSILKFILILSRPSERGKQSPAVREPGEEHLDSWHLAGNCLPDNPSKQNLPLEKSADNLWPLQLGSEMRGHQPCCRVVIWYPQMLVWDGKCYQLSIVSSGLFWGTSDFYHSSWVIPQEITTLFFLFVCFYFFKWGYGRLPCKKQRNKTLFSKRLMRPSLED